ncbi:MAG: hypothetical protein ACLFQB_14535 [Chitinispirillaceae bacterium]
MDLFEKDSSLKQVVSRLAPCMFLFIAVLYALNVSVNWRPEWDSAYYMILAESILSGEGFTYLDYPCLKIPFGFPVLIAPVMYFSDDFLHLNMYMLFFAGLAFWSIYKSFSRVYPSAYAVLITFLSASSALTLFYAGYVMIEFPYLAFSFLSLFFVLSYAERSTLPKGIAAVVFLLITFFLRTVGIALMGAVLVYFILHKFEKVKTIRFAVLSLILILPVAGWLTHKSSVTINDRDPVWQLLEFIPSDKEVRRYRFDDPTSKVNGAGDILRRGVWNAGYYGAVNSSVLTGLSFRLKREDFTDLSKLPYLLFLSIIGMVTMIGFIIAVSEKRTVFDYYFILYTGILLAWAAREPRYLLPVLPMLLHYFITGLTGTAQFITAKTGFSKEKGMRNASAVLFVFCIVYMVLNSVHNYRTIKNQHRADYYSNHMDNFFSSTEWIKDNIEENARIVSVLAPVNAYFSRRWTVSFPRVEDERQILVFLKKIHGDYVLVNPSHAQEEKYLQAVIGNYPHLFSSVHRTGEAVVYRIDREKLAIEVSADTEEGFLPEH